MKITIASKDLKEITANRGGKQYKLQTGWAHLPGEPHPTKFEFFLKSGMPPYELGEYSLNTEQCIAVINGNLRLGDLKLQAVTGK